MDSHNQLHGYSSMFPNQGNQQMQQYGQGLMGVSIPQMQQPAPVPSADNQAMIVTMTRYSSKRAVRDPNAPKRNLSAYLLYQNSMRSTFKQERPELNFGELAKYTSARYAELTPEEKQEWKQKSIADKERYDRELSEYTPPPGYNAKGDALDMSGKVAGRKRAQKAQKDKNAPKRNLSAYLLFQNANRETLKRENPELSFGQLSTLTSAKYSKLTPEEKAVWTKKAEEDKLRYERDLAMYRPPPGFDAQGFQITAGMDDGRGGKRSGKRAARAEVIQFTMPCPTMQYPDLLQHHTDPTDASAHLHTI
mmetsp:Transcript_10955/g.14293  ORF Transcript_10955/g.14293 Transcript_10955/m.14293 type:complete len:307 (-) Transcript_10955:237-1157(-)